MGNDLVGKVVDKMKEFRPKKTTMKIWNKKDLCLVLAVNDPKNWETEMDPYYAYVNGDIAGVSFIDNEEILSKVMKPENLIYKNKMLEV